MWWFIPPSVRHFIAEGKTRSWRWSKKNCSSPTLFWFYYSIHIKEDRWTIEVVWFESLSSQLCGGGVTTPAFSTSRPLWPRLLRSDENTTPEHSRPFPGSTKHFDSVGPEGGGERSGTLPGIHLFDSSRHRAWLTFTEAHWSCCHWRKKESELSWGHLRLVWWSRRRWRSLRGERSSGSQEQDQVPSA